MTDAPLQAGRVRQDTLRLEGLPDRIRTMITLVIQHQAMLTAHNIGSLELHYHGDRVRPKMSCSPEA